jgi:hypothetical protein
MLVGATDHMVDHLQIVLDLEVSVKKSVVVGSSAQLAVNVARACRTQTLTPVRNAKLLGVSSGGGRRRCVKYSKGRIDAFNKRLPRMRKLRRAGVNAAALARAAGTPMVTFGCDVM